MKAPRFLVWVLGAFLYGCRSVPLSTAGPPVTLHLAAKSFDAALWKAERIPGDRVLGARASMAADVLRRFGHGTKLGALLDALDEPFQVDRIGDTRDLPLQSGTYLMLRYPVVQTANSHEDLCFEFDRAGLLLTSRREIVSGAI